MAVSIQWYYVVIAILSTLVLFGTILVLSLVCCKRKRRKNENYFEVPQVELAEESKKENGKYQHFEHFEVQHKHTTQSNGDYASSGDCKLDNIANVNESSAEISESDIDIDIGPVSAYGDTASIVSGSLAKSSVISGSIVTLNTLSKMNISIQTSLIYSKDNRYVAGKIIQVEGLVFEKKSPSHVRVHVVVLPIKKYAIKTNWYEITVDGRTKIEEYFKFLFKLPPSDTKTMFRIRLYGRRMKVGGRAECIGECYINLMEIVSARGGLTIWRALSRGIPPSVAETPEN